MASGSVARSSSSRSRPLVSLRSTAIRLRYRTSFSCCASLLSMLIAMSLGGPGSRSHSSCLAEFGIDQLEDLGQAGGRLDPLARLPPAVGDRGQERPQASGHALLLARS